MYPAIYFSLQRIKHRVADRGSTSFYEHGFGDGAPLAAIAGMVLRVCGSDFSKGVLSLPTARFEAKGFDPSVLTLGDIRDRATVEKSSAAGLYHAMMARDIMSHFRDEDVAILSISAFRGRRSHLPAVLQRDDAQVVIRPLVVGLHP